MLLLRSFSRLGRRLVAEPGEFAWNNDCARITSGDHRPYAHAFYETIGYFRESHEVLMKVLRQQSTEDFGRPYKTFFDAGVETDEQPVLVAVAANTYDHYAEHVGWIKEQLG